MWHLWDFKVHRYTAANKRFRSLKAHGEYDCSKKSVRVLSSAFYEANKAEGAVVLEEAKAGEWFAVTPDSVWQPLWDYACKSG